MEEFLPALVALASTDWELMKPVAVHMLAMLVDKMKKRGIALLSANLPSNVIIMHEHITILNLLHYNGILVQKATHLVFLVTLFSTGILLFTRGSCEKHL